MAVVVGAAVVTTTAVGEVVVVGGHRRSSVGSSPVRWLLRIMPLLFRTLRPMHRHRSMGRGGGVTPRNLITPTHKLAPAGSEPFSHSETETETRVTRAGEASWPSGPNFNWEEFAPDSPLEGTGFEPSVPREKSPTLCVSVLFRSDSSVGGEPTRGDIERLVVSRGTDGSNPVPSSGESGANLIFGDERRRHVDAGVIP